MKKRSLNNKFQIEIVSTGVHRVEVVYDCCPDEKYPNLSLSVVFKQKGMFYHDKLHKPEDAKAKKKAESSEENN